MAHGMMLLIMIPAETREAGVWVKLSVSVLVTETAELRVSVLPLMDEIVVPLGMPAPLITCPTKRPVALLTVTLFVLLAALAVVLIPGSTTRALLPIRPSPEEKMSVPSV